MSPVWPQHELWWLPPRCVFLLVEALRLPGQATAYACGVLVEMLRDAKAWLKKPVLAWVDIQADL